MKMLVYYIDTEHCLVFQSLYIFMIIKVTISSIPIHFQKLL